MDYISVNGHGLGIRTRSASAIQGLLVESSKQFESVNGNPENFLPMRDN